MLNRRRVFRILRSVLVMFVLNEVRLRTELTTDANETFLKAPSLVIDEYRTSAKNVCDEQQRPRKKHNKIFWVHDPIKIV